MNDISLYKNLSLLLTSCLLLFFSCGKSELEFKTKGNISGTISDASNGNAVTGVTVTHSLDNSTTTSDASGDFSFSSLSPGTHTFSFSKTNYTSQSTNFSIESSTTTNGNIALLNSTISTDKIAIVLTWGESPNDLDSHLYIPTGAASTTEILHSSKGDADRADPPHAYLDVDDTSKYGPETTTIRFQSNETDYDRTYRFFITNFNHGNNGVKNFNESNAVVRFYKNGSLMQEWKASTTATEKYWLVFDMGSDGSITSQNTYSSSKPSTLY